MAEQTFVQGADGSANAQIDLARQRICNPPAFNLG
jgi:hypothetical protein